MTERFVKRIINAQITHAFLAESARERTATVTFVIHDGGGMCFPISMPFSGDDWRERAYAEINKILNPVGIPQPADPGPDDFPAHTDPHKDLRNANWKRFGANWLVRLVYNGDNFKPLAIGHMINNHWYDLPEAKLIRFSAYDLRLVDGQLSDGHNMQIANKPELETRVDHSGFPHVSITFSLTQGGVKHEGCLPFRHHELAGVGPALVEVGKVVGVKKLSAAKGRFVRILENGYRDPTHRIIMNALTHDASFTVWVSSEPGLAPFPSVH